MKCLFCNNTIDESQVIDQDDLGLRKKHALALQEWRQLTVHLNMGSQLTLLSAHVCKDHVEKLTSGTFTLAITGNPVEGKKR